MRCARLVDGKIDEFQNRSQCVLGAVDQVVVVDDVDVAGEVLRPLQVHLFPGVQLVCDKLLPICGEKRNGMGGQMAVNGISIGANKLHRPFVRLYRSGEANPTWPPLCRLNSATIDLSGSRTSRMARENGCHAFGPHCGARRESKVKRCRRSFKFRNYLVRLHHQHGRVANIFGRKSALQQTEVFVDATCVNSCRLLKQIPQPSVAASL